MMKGRTVIIGIFMCMLCGVSFSQEGVYKQAEIDKNTIRFNDLSFQVAKPDNWIFHKSQGPYNLAVISKGQEIAFFEPMISLNVNPEQGNSLESFARFIMDSLAGAMKQETLVVLGGLRKITVAGQEGLETKYAFSRQNRTLIITTVLFIKNKIGYSIIYQNEDKNISRDAVGFDLIIKNLKFE